MTTQIGNTTDDERGLLPYPVIIADLSPAEQLQYIFQTALNGQEPSIPTIKGWQTNQEYPPGLQAPISFLEDL